MSKPEWKDAPKGFDWAAMDSSGDWYFYDREPVAMLVSWVNVGGDFHKSLLIGSDRHWKETLEHRP